MPSKKEIVLPDAPPARPHATSGRAAWWAGWILSLLPALMLLVGGVMDLVFKPQFVVEGMAQAGYAEGVIRPLGAVTVACVILYLIPPTAAVGAILLTGYLGGAVATHVRLGDPVVYYFMPAIVAAVLWTGLILRDRRLRAVLPIR